MDNTNRTAFDRHSPASGPAPEEPTDHRAGAPQAAWDHPPSGGAAPHPGCLMMRRLVRAVAGGDLPFLHASPVALGLQAPTKEEAIRAMISSLAESGDLPEEQIQEILAAVLVRESLASTGIGQGVAIPHARHAAVTRLTGAIGWSTQGIDFDSLDNAPVRLIILLLSPPDGHAEHLQALANVARHLQSDRWSLDAQSRPVEWSAPGAVVGRLDEAPEAEGIAPIRPVSGTGPVP